MSSRKHPSRSAYRRANIGLYELENRLTPNVTTAALSGGMLTIVSDNGTDFLELSVQGNGAFVLTDSGNNVALSGSPTIANVIGIDVQLGNGDDRLDLSQVPDGFWTVVVDGGLGADSILGSAGSDNLQGGTGEDTIDGGPGDDVIDGGDFADTLRGGPGDDLILGRQGNDDIFGDAGNDVLIGHEGRDDFLGGPGDDFYDGFKDDDNSEDEVRETAFTNLTATNFSLEGVGFDTFKGVDTITLDGNQGNNILDASACTIPVLIRGNGGDDSMIGGSGNDVILGGTGNDTAYGGAGDDFFDGDADNDNLNGGAGNDSITGDLGDDTLDGNDGVDRIVERADVNFTLSKNKLVGVGSDKFVGIELAQLEGGSGPNKIAVTNFVGTTTLLGGNGADTLIGGKGTDFLSGQGGKDSLDGGGGNDSVVETTFTTLDFVLTNTHLTGGTVFDETIKNIETARLTATTTANTLDASAFTKGGVFLDGGSGDDILIGTSKNDTLVGNQGNDSIDGKGGIDTVQETGDANFTLSTGGATSTLTGTNNFGTDTLTSIEQAVLTGGDSGNTINASGFTAGPVTLIGGAGDDTLTGGTQNDVLTGGLDNDSLVGNTGIDTVEESSNDSGATLTDTSLAGSSNGLGTSNVLNGIEQAHLIGGTGNNNFTVSGWTGTAVLNGGGADDTVISTNNLNFVLVDGKLTRSDNAVFTLVSIERASLTGGAADNEFDIGGFSGTISLNGGGGTGDVVVAKRNTNMTLSNTALLFGDAAGASLSGISKARLTGGGGSNRIDASAFTLGSVFLKGLGGNDTLVGGSGDDTLDGGAGTDNLDGGLGNDTAIGGEIKKNFP
jgi:Ca2+-binding RTX toxin-like protein